MSSKEEVKLLIVKEGLTVKKLAGLLVEKTGRHYTQSSLQQKITSSSLRYDEIEDITELLGYEIKIERKRKYD